MMDKIEAWGAMIHQANEAEKREAFRPVKTETEVVDETVLALAQENAALRAELAALKSGDVVMVPEVKFSAFVHGNRVRFSVDQQSFTLDYEPDTAEELYWMRDRLDAALSKIAAAPGVQAGEKDNAVANSAAEGSPGREATES